MLSKNVFIGLSIVVGLTVMYVLQNGGGESRRK